MKTHRSILLIALLVACLGIAQAKDTKPAAKRKSKPRPVTIADADSWKSIRSATVSNDGQWFAYVVRPSKGSGELVLRKLGEGEQKDRRFAIGVTPGGQPTFSFDSKRFGLLAYPGEKEAVAARKSKKPLAGKLTVLSLGSDEQLEIKNVRSFTFSGEQAGWLALRMARSASATSSSATSAGKSKPSGSDLILHELSTGHRLNLGNVSEFAFNKSGALLAVVIDAAGQAGNGVQLYNVTSGIVRSIESGEAKYSKLSWNKQGNALAVLKGIDDKQLEQPLTSVIGWRDLELAQPKKTVFDPKERTDFPEGMTVSGDRAPMWTADLSMLLFGIHKSKKKDVADSKKKPGAADEAVKSARDTQTKGPPRKKPAGSADLTMADGLEYEMPSATEEVAGNDTQTKKRKSGKRVRRAERRKPAKAAGKKGSNGKKVKGRKPSGKADPRKKPGSSKKPKPPAAKAGQPKPKPKPKPKPDAKKPPGKKPAKAKEAGKSDEKPAQLVIWHWQDKRLQSQQQKEESRDKKFSYLCAYGVGSDTFVRLADEKTRTVSIAPEQRWAIGYDDTQYRLESSLDGRRYRDVHVIDPRNGQRWLALKKLRWGFGASPDGNRYLYYDDGHFYTYDIPTRKSYQITKNVPVSFVNTEDDHNQVKPPIRPWGWAADSASVLLYDNWDVWHVPACGGAATNLTANGRRDNIRYRTRFRLDREEIGIDLTRAQYVSALGEWTKKSGIGVLKPGVAGIDMLLWDDALFSRLMKARNADIFLYARETERDFPNYDVAGAALKGRRVTDAFPQQKQYLWTAGSRLVDYTNDRGEKLQAALLLPAGYRKGRRCPTIVYIYEKLSSRLHRYSAPRIGGFSPSIYTSQGYAVLMPDITYRLNDPGLSAVGCVLPALDAAVKAGVVDPKHVGLHGHSWGGYQTAFLITQTNKFAAAVAGAPLTNMISMYSSIYWNSGSANQPIFESSQGRFTGGYLENMQAYSRNSPVYYADRVNTPLLLLHNDQDGAVDWNQGIEYFNTLRRLRKPVVMLQYKGENHGLAKRENQRDYSRRMLEFFDHYLKEKTAPKWLREGVSHLDLPDHLKKRAKKATPGGTKK